MSIELNASPITFNQILAIVLSIVFLVLCSATWHYHSAYRTKSDALLLLQYDVEKQNKEETEKLALLTTERDKKQAVIDQQAKDQEQKDETAKSDIATLNNQLRSSPIRVRVITKPSGCSSGSATIDPAASAANSAADETAGYGVLPESNTRRLADALSEVETLSAAYSSCRAIELPP